MHYISTRGAAPVLTFGEAMMTGLARDGGLSHFDQVLNAALVLSYLALRQGDGVGLHAIGGEPRWVAPKRGMGTIDDLLRASHDLQPQPVATDYLAAATRLSVLQPHDGRQPLAVVLGEFKGWDYPDMGGRRLSPSRARAAAAWRGARCGTCTPLGLPVEPDV